jgi:hypothetical protein
VIAGLSPILADGLRAWPGRSASLRRAGVAVFRATVSSCTAGPHDAGIYRFPKGSKSHYRRGSSRDQMVKHTARASNT